MATLEDVSNFKKYKILYGKALKKTLTKKDKFRNG